jgi:hypothetical protein
MRARKPTVPWDTPRDCPTGHLRDGGTLGRMGQLGRLGRKRHGPALVLTLPAPPSLNNLFLTAGRRRVKSPQYRRWLTAAGQRQGCIGGPWEAHIVLPATLRGDAEARDGAILLSLLLQHGCSLETIQNALLRNPDGGPAGPLGAVVDLLSGGRA